jgi:predicted PhzF superfamily epimerase YddE/YHI9
VNRSLRRYHYFANKNAIYDKFFCWGAEGGETSMRIPIYQIDAFAERRFEGNPAAVCPLEAWPDDDLLQKIAAENNLAETAFFVRQGPDYALRWFTPKCEIDLCGHATLASAYVLFTYLEPGRDHVRFHTLSGVLEVTQEGDLLAMIFPARPGARCDAPAALVQGLRRQPLEVYKSRDYMAVFGSEQEILDLQPSLADLMQLDLFGIIVTAPGEEVDFVSRFFAPNAGIDEDPVTGSAHSTLIPYWKERLGKDAMVALQLSARRGKLYCTDLGDKVKISGKAAPYLEGFINV